MAIRAPDGANKCKLRAENQSPPKKLKNRKTSPCSPCAPILLHVLPSRMVGWNELCNPATLGVTCLSHWVSAESIESICTFVSMADFEKALKVLVLEVHILYFFVYFCAGLFDLFHFLIFYMTCASLFVWPPSLSSSPDWFLSFQSHYSGAD